MQQTTAQTFPEKLHICYLRYFGHAQACLTTLKKKKKVQHVENIDVYLYAKYQLHH